MNKGIVSRYMVSSEQDSRKIICIFPKWITKYNVLLYPKILFILSFHLLSIVPGKKGCALKFNIFFYKDQKIEKIISVIYPAHSSYEDFFPRAEKNYSSPFIPHSPKGLLYVKEAVAFPFLPFDPWKALVCKTGSYFLITGALTKVQTIWD